MLSSVDFPLLQLCALFAPPFAFSLLAVAHTLHHCDFQLWQTKLHCYQSTRRLHLRTLLTQPLQQPKQPTDATQQPLSPPQPHSEQQVGEGVPTVKSAVALLPAHKQRELRLAHDSSLRTSRQPTQQTQQAADTEQPTASGSDSVERDETAALHTAAMRWKAARWLSISLVLLAVCLPTLQLAAWTALLIVTGHAQCAAALVLLTSCVAALVVAFGSWQRRGWYWSGHVTHLLALALTSFIALSLLLTYLSASSSSTALSFFSRSVHFVCLHLVAVVECRAVSEQEQAAALLPYIRAQERDTQHEDDRRRADKRRKRQQRLEAVRRTLNYHVAQHDHESEDEQSRQKQAGSESDDAGTADIASGRARLSELPSHTHSFASHIRAKAAKARVKHRSLSQRRLLTLRVAAVLILAAYSAVIGAQVDAPSADSDGAAPSFDGRFLGVLVSLCILLFDMFLSLLSDRLSTFAQLSLALVTRLLLISFDEGGWFLAFCFLFLVYGSALCYLWADSFLPHHRLASPRVTRTLSTRPVRMTLSSFLTEPADNAATGSVRPLLSVLQSANSLLSIPAFLSLVLLTLFLMSLCVAYTTHPPLVSVPAISSVQYEQWMVGVLSLLLWLVLSSAVVLVKSLLFFSFHLNWLTCCASAVVQLAFAGCGLYVWRDSDSALFLLLFCLLPPFCISLLATYCLSIASLPTRSSVRSLIACCVCVVLLSSLGVSVSELFSPSDVGWSAVFCVLIVLSSVLPLVKYRSTLTLDAVDEWSVLLCLVLLSGFLSLLSWRLSLSSLGNYVLALCGTGYVVLVLLAGAWSDWRLNSRLTPFSLFVLSAHYVWLLAFSVVLFVVYSVYVGVCAVVGVVLYVSLSLCFLCWLWNNYTLPFSLRCLLSCLVGSTLLCGVAAAVYLSVSSSSGTSVSFFAFSAVYLFVVLSVALSAAFQHYGALWRAPCLIHFSSSVFPVVLFNKRSSAVSHLHLPLCLLLCSAALFVLWCLSAIVCGYRDVGLSSSAVCVVVLWLILRELSFSAPRCLLPLRGLLDEASVLRVRGIAWRVVCGGYECDEAMADAVRSLEAGHDARRGLRDRQRAMRQRMKLTLSSSNNPLTAMWQLAAARPQVQCLDVDWLLASLHDSESALRRVCCLQVSLDAQCTFLLRLEGNTRRREDESLFALFCVWARKHKQLDALHSHMQPADTWGWTAAERRNVRLAVDEWNKQRAARREQCEQDRVVEQCAHRRREDASQAADQSAVCEQTDGGSGGAASVDPYGALSTTGQARGSSNSAFTANKSITSATQRNRLRATRVQQQQHRPQHEQRQPPHGTVAAASDTKSAPHGKPHTRRVPHSEHNDGSDLLREQKEPAQPHTRPTAEEDRREPAAQSCQPETDENRVHGEQQAQSSEEKQPPQHDQHGEQHERGSSSEPPDETSRQAKSAAPLSVPAVLSSHEEAHALFSRIAAEYDSSGVKWVDASFPASDRSIYIGGCRDPVRPSAVHQAPVAGWQRPDAILKAVTDNGAVDGAGEASDGVVRLVAGGYSCNDVVQGNIGTCYFLSALGVMALHASTDGSPPLLANALPSLYNNAPSHPSGCYLVCFYRRHSPLYVFVDDQLPVQENGLPAFSHCRHAGELWVALMEKAYAKLFGCYEAIEAGYVHQALMDCTSGQGEEVRLKDEDGRLRQAEESLWVRMYESFRAGCMLGAGSNTGTNDHEVDGIVQGHAYGIIGMYEGSAGEEADSGGGLRLIQLNNPWGRGEWTGDWSDDSDKWTRYYVNRLQPSKQDDGRFWMEFGDFLQHYENVYICRMMPHALTLNASWATADGTAAGPRQPRNNPHFTLKAEQSTTVHIEVEQETAAAVSKADPSEAAEAAPGIGSNGYAYIQFYLVDNGGQRVDKIVRSTVRGWANDGRLVNARSISAQVELEAGKDYALLCCTNMPNVERAFSVSVFSCEPVTLTAIA